MTKTPNLQDVFLSAARRNETPDAFTVVLTADGKQNLIYKHAISTVSPARPVDLSSWEEDL